MLATTCCVTGHREIPPDKIAYVQEQLRRELLQAVEDGYTRFLSGFAQGVDLYFAGLVGELRKEHEAIGLEAALPYRQRFCRLHEDARTRPLLLACTMIGVHSEAYAPDVFARRNRYMVAQSSRVIAVYDGRRTGGTAATIRYAEAQGRQIRLIAV